MKILVVGSGAREHAVLRTLNREGGHSLFSIGTNPGIAELATEIPGILETDGLAIAHACTERGIELVIIGPEAPLAAGVVDDIKREAGVPVFGPSQEAAALEASKSFAKEIMKSAGIPTGEAIKCHNLAELNAALERVGSQDPYVVKADGLAAGKGVIVTRSLLDAQSHAEAVFAGGGFVIVEEYLAGPEFSQFFICDGKTALALEPAQDFKRIFDGDEGPNTGGMGAYTPLDWLPSDTSQWCLEHVARKTVDEMARRGTPFTGVLFAGLVYTQAGVKVIEFNVRFGDPETQVVLERLQTPLAPLLLAAAQGVLKSDIQLKWSQDYFCNVVLASKGYPESSSKGDVISGINAAESRGAVILQAGTKYSDSDIGQIVTNGGRVLSVVGKGNTLKLARERAYNFVKMIKFTGQQHRTDIALKAQKGEIGT